MLWGEMRCTNPEHFTDDDVCYCTDRKVWVPIVSGSYKRMREESRIRPVGPYQQWQTLIVLPDGRRPDEPTRCAYCKRPVRYVGAPCQVGC